MAAERYPVFDVTDLDHRLAHVSSVIFDIRNLELEATPASIVVTAPGYTFAHADPNEMRCSARRRLSPCACRESTI